MQTAKFVVLFLIWSAKTKSSVTVKMLNSYKVVTKQKGVPGISGCRKDRAGMQQQYLQNRKRTGF